ncbi:hypothetical protein [Methylobacterium sp. Leaf106]|uniref:hypothetical protein n=1 Tax=Methylobacterium sp. Leaf106 TaxID=1736255 RepID=UPI0006F9E253|nr:hypothetical protein [Methylobacterium sp. Leaf106]KQP52987.1 hypothetical protein ASF34_01030 [Methylobacterium sp. Leaf106]
MRYVVLGTNNDGGRNATIHSTLDEAKDAVRAYLLDPENDPTPTEDDARRIDGELSIINGSYVDGIRGADEWKEWIYIAPVNE